jgi:hypothetical protein
MAPDLFVGGAGFSSGSSSSSSSSSGEKESNAPHARALKAVRGGIAGSLTPGSFASGAAHKQTVRLQGQEVQLEDGNEEWQVGHQQQLVHSCVHSWECASWLEGGERCARRSN